MARAQHLFGLILGITPVPTLAQSAAIFMDGRFDDWTPGLATFMDNNTPASGIDLLSMQVTNDDQYLFVRLNVGTEIDLLDDLVPQTIRLYIDGDNSAATGNAAQTGYGAELQIKFDTRVVTEYFGTSSTVSWSTVDLTPLPTTSGTSFEIAISRAALPDGSNALFSSPTIKLLFRESDGGDAMPNTGSTFSYTFDSTPVAPFMAIDPARNSSADVRVMAWNVLGDGLTQAALQDEYQRMLAAIGPDVIGFSECVSSTAAQVKTRLDAWIPLGGNGWYVVKDDFDMVIASRWPIAQSWPSLTRQFAALIDLPSSYATDLLFTAAHLHCCTADADRQNEADEYVQFVQDAMNPGGAFTLPINTPMIYAGDLNSVGYAQQLNTLLTGDIQNNATYGPDGSMDWDGSALASAEPIQTHARMAYTWRSTTSAYPNGLLDHLFYTDAVATLSKSFVLRTEVMPTGTLASLGLQSTDAATASDHFALTSDFEIPLAAVRLNVRCFLEGAFAASEGMMHDSLRVKGLLPAQEPYTALGLFPDNSGAGMGTGVLGTSGANAIVDWVLLEVRSAIDPAVVVATKCALLQRDGDIVDLNGTSPVSFSVTEGDYRVAVRHRNHFGAMSANTVTLGASIASLDLTSPSTATYGIGATKPIGNVLVLWAGNVLRDGALKYVGGSNDRDPILVRVGGSVPTATATGYFNEDVNLDGNVRYVGAANDRDPILVNIGGNVPTNTRSEQMP